MEMINLDIKWCMLDINEEFLSTILKESEEYIVHKTRNAPKMIIKRESQNNLQYESVYNTIKCDKGGNPPNPPL